MPVLCQTGQTKCITAYKSVFLKLFVEGRAFCVKGPESNRTSQTTTIVFNGSKKEQFTPTNGFKSLHRKLKTNWKVAVYVDLLLDITTHQYTTAKSIAVFLSLQLRLP